MPRVWYATPSARPVEEAQRCFDAWRNMECAVAATRKVPDLELDRLVCLREYPGLWAATNYLVKVILEDDPECEVVVTGGDDCWPGSWSGTAEDVADEFVAHFKGTLGVMQTKGPTRGHDRCAWSPWLGREWCERAFEGRGATEPVFWHNFGDAYLYAVAERMGLLWERSDLKVEHRKWNIQTPRQRPKHLAKAAEMWQADKELFDKLAGSGFPGSALLPKGRP